MGVMSIREFNANISKVIAQVEAGEVIELTRNGKVVAEIKPKRASKMDDPEYRARWEAMMASMRKGIPGLMGPFTYEERTER